MDRCVCYGGYIIYGTLRKKIEDAVARMQSIQPNRCIDELSGVSDWQRDAMRKEIWLFALVSRWKV